MKISSFFKTLSISSIAVVSCSLSSVIQSQTTPTMYPQDDCSGIEDESYGVSGTPCQNYQGDLYENWNPNDGGHGDTDIKTFSVGEDNTYFYFELDLREDWDYDGTGESRKYYLEIEADGDGQSDYFLVYQPKRNDLGSSWKNIGGNGEIEVYQDQNNSIGGSNPTGADSGDADGYEAEVSPNKNLTWL